MGQVDLPAQVVLDADHPVGLQLADALESRVAPPAAAATAACARARRAWRTRTSPPPPLRRRPRASRTHRRPRRGRRAHRSATASCPMWKRTPRRLSRRTQGSIQASLVGASSTRSSAPSLPRCMMFMMNASAMLPMVRVDATVSLAATSDAGQARAPRPSGTRPTGWPPRCSPTRTTCSHWPQPALVAAGQEHGEPRGQVGRLVRAAPSASSRSLPCSSVCRPWGESARPRGRAPCRTAGRRRARWRAPSGPRWCPQGCPRHRCRSCRRDAAHRVGHVVVEAGEEAEAVLAGQPLAAALRALAARRSSGPCRPAPRARTHPPGSRAPPARGPRSARPCRRPARPRACRRPAPMAGAASGPATPTAAAAMPASRMKRRRETRRPGPSPTWLIYFPSQGLEQRAR